MHIIVLGMLLCTNFSHKSQIFSTWQFPYFPWIITFWGHQMHLAFFLLNTCVVASTWWVPLGSFGFFSSNLYHKWQQCNICAGLSFAQYNHQHKFLCVNMATFWIWDLLQFSMLLCIWSPTFPTPPWHNRLYMEYIWHTGNPSLTGWFPVCFWSKN